MSNAVPRRELLSACIEAIDKAEQIYTEWTPENYSMRAAPESFVQMQIAQELFAVDKTEGGVKLLLEASVIDLLKNPKAKVRTGRIDIVVYYKSKKPRLIIEVKKITKSTSLNQDLKRVLTLMEYCKEIQNGVLVGYGTRAKNENLKKLFGDTKSKLLDELTGNYKNWRVECVRGKSKPSIKTKKGERYLQAVVYKVSRPKTSNNQ